MAINLFSDYGGFYNNYKLSDIPKVDVSTVREQDEEKQRLEQAIPDIPKVEEIREVEPDNRSRMADLDNISLTFNAGEDYSYIGSDFEITSLDMEQAISDMRKDKILEDYQFFVGASSELNTENNAVNNEDGKFFIKF